MKEGVIIEHGCGKRLFLSKETLEKMCLIICPKCKAMISLTLFGDTTKDRLLSMCKPHTEQQIHEVLKE